MNRIRNATAGDAEALAALVAALGYAADGAAITARLADIAAGNAGVVLVAEAADGQVNGCACVVSRDLLILPRFAELAALVVAAGARGGGVGAALMAAAEDWARGRGLGELRVRSNITRERAHRFYLRAGCREQKRQVVFVKSL